MKFCNWAFIALLCVSSVTCCTSQPTALYTAAETVLQYDRSQLKRAFVFLKLDIKLKICAQLGDNEICQEGKETATASGFVIDRLDKSFDIITAAHFCTDHLGKIEKTRTIAGVDYRAVGESTLTITDYAGHVFIHEQNKIIAQDIRNNIDICMIRVNDVTSKLDILPAELADNPPAWGDYIFHVGAPHGTFAPGEPMIFLGVFIGRPNDRDVYIVSTYTLPGSSGGMIVDTRGQVIGMIIEYIPTVQPHGGNATTLTNIRQFICENVEQSRRPIFDCSNKT